MNRRELVQRVVAEGAERDRAIEHDRDSQTYVEITQMLDPRYYASWEPIDGYGHRKGQEYGRFVAAGEWARKRIAELHADDRK